MEKEMYVFLGAIGAALISYLAQSLNSRNQIKIAEKNLEQHLRLQDEKMAGERLIKEVELERNKLEQLHVVLSLVAFENSQTMSYIQSGSETGLDKFRTRYIENTIRLHEAEAIAEIYYPEMLERLKVIYSEANKFWGYQEQLIQTDIKENKSGWESALYKVQESGTNIYSHVKDLKTDIAKRGKLLKQEMLP
ncbi:hypothetical protein LZT09_03610 [Vibrio fluvialis]|uniref:hypothetical protein n=1 Tax=Vibrio fluvialis TaxID=676 RepID=UPI001F317403|nr:hypothetical protein [Vibrio fluvialis]MCE7613678.1 hypothetical protein [Vibrio fluvialis]MCG6368291.1 hypothetical protein [Vibrio fluvialis]MCG6377147.1 hypothetical protein [Vibrio fluvialis]